MAHLKDGDAVDQRRTHRAHQRPVLQPVAGGHDPCARRQRMFTQPPLQQQRIKRLLHIRRAGRQFIEKQAERLRLFRQQNTRRAEHRALADNARHAADILRRDLRAEQRTAGQARLARRLIHHLGFADARRRQQKKALLMRHALDQLLRLPERDDLVERGLTARHGMPPPGLPPLCTMAHSRRCGDAPALHQRRAQIYIFSKNAARSAAIQNGCLRPIHPPMAADNPGADFIS